MWVAAFTIKHDCILGNRCKRFGVTLQSVNFSIERTDNDNISNSLHVMIGGDKDSFVQDLKKDEAVISLERRGDTFFLREKAESKAVRFHKPSILFIKPVLTDSEGNEYWEVASWDRQELSSFVRDVESLMPEFRLHKMIETPVDEVFFPQLLPELTTLQKEALDLAIREGYYETPKSTDLRTLAKEMGVSLSTFQEHLSKAESKVLPQITNYF